MLLKFEKDLLQLVPNSTKIRAEGRIQNKTSADQNGETCVLYFLNHCPTLYVCFCCMPLGDFRMTQDIMTNEVSTMQCTQRVFCNATLKDCNAALKELILR